MLIRAIARNDSEKSQQVVNEKEDNENLDLDLDMGLPEVRFYPGVASSSLTIGKK